MVHQFDSMLLAKQISSFNNDSSSYHSFIERLGEAQLILMGGSTHGTYEFYKIRSEITKALIKEKGFNAIAIEADWPDVYNLNLYVKNQKPEMDDYAALKTFETFPSWMWCNDVILDFIRWLRAHNDKIQDSQNKLGIFGLDLYSLHTSMKLVIEYLEKIDPTAAEQAKERYQCMEQYSEEPTTYSYAVAAGLVPDCKDEVYTQLIEILKMEIQTLRDPDASQEELLFLIQNAKVVANAEAYYRSLFSGPEITWNLRSKHMMDTLETLRVFHQRLSGRPPKIIVWAHNVHIGDARATHMAQKNKISMGQLARDHYGEKCYLLGFSSYEGTVTASSKWGGDTEVKKLQPAAEGSYEYLFHQLNTPSFVLYLEENIPLIQPALQRSIGVIYKPETESVSHYHYAHLPQQFNAIIHVDSTTAVKPLNMKKHWGIGEFPDTFPTGY